MIEDLMEKYDRPVLVSEFGADWRWFDSPYHYRDKEEIEIHNGIWSSVLSGSASSAMLWWWDNYIHPNDPYYHFDALSKYLEGINPDRAGLGPLEMRLLSPEEIDAEDLEDLKVYPSVGWTRPESNVFELDLYGGVTNVSQLGGSVRGRYHPELKNNPTFIVDLRFGGEVIFHVNSAANSGAVLEVYVDGSLARTVSLPDKDGANDAAVSEYDMDVAISVAPGRHEIGLDNAGDDWFTFDYVEFTNAVLKVSKARVIGLMNETFAMVWVQNKDHTWWNVINEVPIETLGRVDLELLGLTSGEYLVEWWNTYSGKMVGRETANSVDGKLSLSIEDLYEDVAAKVYIKE